MTSERTAQAEEMAKRGYVTVREAASRLKVAVSTIYRAIALGKLKATKVGERRYIDEKSLKAYANGWELGDNNADST